MITDQIGQNGDTYYPYFHTTRFEYIRPNDIRMSVHIDKQDCPPRFLFVNCGDSNACIGQFNKKIPFLYPLQTNAFKRPLRAFSVVSKNITKNRMV